VKTFGRNDVSESPWDDCGVRPRALHVACTRPKPAPLAACLLPSPTISHPSHNRLQQKMALEEAISILKVLVPIAKAVPVLGAPVEGSLEALSKILEFAQARRLHADMA
jgi:hypothetical protein